MADEPQGIPPSPVPTQYFINIVPTNRGPFLTITFSHPVGSSIFFFDAEGAEHFANQLRAQAIKAKTGLIVADGAGLDASEEISKVVESINKNSRGGQ